jgi:8-oxo-dGTP pyrophosphatase MutT (NUDIX family)
MDFIDRFKRNLQAPLPGKEAQYEMARNFRSRAEISAPPNARTAGVLMLFYPKNDEWHLAFIRRRAHEKDPHSAQIGFPGGKYEREDGSLMQTALREAMEETGVAPDQVQILGALTSLYIPVSNFEVHPFVGYSNARPEFVPQEEEVDDIIEIPFACLLDPGSVQTTNLKVRDYLLKNVHCFKFEDHIIWGATAMMLNELVTVAKR